MDAELKGLASALQGGPEGVAKEWAEPSHDSLTDPTSPEDMGAETQARNGWRTSSHPSLLIP